MKKMLITCMMLAIFAGCSTETTSYRPAASPQILENPEVEQPLAWRETWWGKELVREARPDLFVETNEWKVTKIYKHWYPELKKRREQGYGVSFEMCDGTPGVTAIDRKQPLTAETIREAVTNEIERLRINNDW